MEHGILRGNKASPTNPWVLIGLPKFSSGYFKAEDARTALVSNSCNRVHSVCITCSLLIKPTDTHIWRESGHSLHCDWHSYMLFSLQSHGCAASPIHQCNMSHGCFKPAKRCCDVGCTAHGPTHSFCPGVWCQELPSHQSVHCSQLA